MKNVDFQAVIDLLSKGLGTYENIKAMAFLGSKKIVSEWMTISIKTGRQSGKTKFFLGLVNQGKAILFERSDIIETLHFEVSSEYEDRILSYEDFNPESLDKFKNLVTDIKYICLSDTDYYKLDEKVYDKLIEIFGYDFVVVQS